MWYPTKTSLYDKKPKDHDVIVSTDKDGSVGSKMFTSFKSVNDFVSFQSKLKISHLYEVIPEKGNTPCFIFFDLDRSFDDCTIDDEYYNKVIDTFFTVFHRFLKDMYDINTTLVMGKTIQVAYTPTPSKFSCHIKINIKVPSLIVLENLVINLDKYLCSNLYTSVEERQLFYYYKGSKDGNKDYVPVIDRSVYSNFRSFRTLNSSKLKNISAKKIPFGSCSKDMKDHLVRVYDDNPQDLDYSVIPFKDIPISADYTKLKSQHITHNISNKKSGDGIGDPCPFVQPDILKRIEELIKNDKSIEKMLQTSINLKYNKAISPTIFRFVVSPESKCLCPYAGRVHKSNRCMFDYHHLTNTIRYKCFDEQCIEQDHISFNVMSDFDSLSRLCTLNNTKTMHCKYDVIQWDEVYDAVSMQEYPLNPMVCIRGNMGSAKTTILVNEFMHKYCSNENTKCLFITYQILLSRKYSGMLDELGFKSYQDISTSTISGYNKIIICLDSLWRVNTTNFDYIFIDEALSVLLHFNSPLMKNVGRVSAVLELLLYQAKYIYILDACVDNTLTFNFVNYISQKKNISPYWIINTYVRPSNRKCNIIWNDNRRAEKLLKIEAINKVCEILERGERVVLSSSTKTFTEQLEAEVNERFDKMKKVLVYNSDTNKALVMDHASRPNEVWTQYDLLVYSPSISAGISFEMSHFHELVCFMDNTLYTPGVDLSIQQMFRVRQLINGQMTVYLNNVPINKTEYPMHEDLIDIALETNLSDIHYESATTVTSHGIMYDKDKMSYQILKGILLNRNKSLMEYKNILVNTLEKDYNIPCHLQQLTVTDDALKKAIELYEKLKDTTIQEIPYSEELVIDIIEYDTICRKTLEHAEVTPLEKMQKWVYEITKNLWGLQEPMDKCFFDTYIGQHNPTNTKKMFEKFYKAHRLQDVLTHPYSENQARLQLKINTLVAEEDYNISLYKTKMRTYYKKLLAGQKILDFLFDQGYKETLINGEDIKIDSTNFATKMKNYFEGMTHEEFENTRKTFELKRSTYTTKNTVMENDNLVVCFVRNVLNEAFEVVMKTVRKTNNHKKNSYNVFSYAVDIKEQLNMENKYKPYNFVIKREELTFVPSDTEDELEYGVQTSLNI